VFNLDFYCPDETIEEALYRRDPEHFVKYKPEKLR
jgi:hypothetical protein